MKILHMCLANFYIDNYNYQENALPRQNKLDGHEVLIIASTETYINNKELGYIEPGEYLNEDGIIVKRIPYRRLPTQILKAKMRCYPQVYREIEVFKPDVILFHSPCSYELLTVAKYKENNPSVKLFVDSHEDFNNSAKGFISKNILHNYYYKKIVHKSLSAIDKVFYLSSESRDFLNDFYKIPDRYLEFYPLGGTVFADDVYYKKREMFRKRLGLNDNNILCIHSGKMDVFKRTIDIINAFLQNNSDLMRLVIIGSMTDEVAAQTEPLIASDSRIMYLGWKTADELMDYLCAADVYIQPGGQSATMQNAICCRCAMMLYPHKSHQPYLQGNGFYVETVEDMRKAFQGISDNPEILLEMSSNSLKIANELLDYRKIAARLYQ